MCVIICPQRSDVLDQWHPRTRVLRGAGEGRDWSRGSSGETPGTELLLPDVGAGHNHRLIRSVADRRRAAMFTSSSHQNVFHMLSLCHSFFVFPSLRHRPVSLLSVSLKCELTSSLLLDPGAPHGDRRPCWNLPGLRAVRPAAAGARPLRQS